MSRCLRFVFELIDDVVISGGAATTGAHSGLDYLPGSTIRGAVASKIYASAHVNHDDLWTLFHSGSVTFDDALPAPSDARGETFPVPLSFHFPKDIPKHQEYAATINLCRGRLPEGRQAEQWRKGYVTQDGRHVKVGQRYVLKTAISSATGMPEQGQLFGHHRIMAGERFCGGVTFDAQVEDRLVDAVKEILDGEVLLGRSRRAEVGRVSVAALVAEDPPRSSMIAVPSNQAVVWLLSDTALFDDYGRSTHVPSPAHFGLAAGEFVPAQSFVKTQRRAWFNAALGAHEPEQFVITRGSILFFQTPHPQPERWGRAGMHQALGLGRFVINHPLMTHAPLQFSLFSPAARETVREIATAEPLSADEQGVLDWLSVSGAAKFDQTHSRIQDIAQPLTRYYRDAATVQGAPNALGPSAAQWAGVFTSARTCGTMEALRKILFGSEKDRGICSDRRSDVTAWEASFPEEERMITFRDWLRAEFDAMAEDNTQDPRIVMQLLAREAKQIAQRILSSSGER